MQELLPKNQSELQSATHTVMYQASFRVPYALSRTKQTLHESTVTAVPVPCLHLELCLLSSEDSEALEEIYHGSLET